MWIQICQTHITQSPEVTSKGLPGDEEVSDNVKSLSDKLSTALLKISAKEDLVNQHAKVAEEAVSGLPFSRYFDSNSLN